MIRKEDFTRLRNEIKEAVDEAFEYAKRNEKNENDYILFLSRSHYDTDIDPDRFNPWQIDHALQEFTDRHRVDFLLQYLNEQYNFRAENSMDSKFTLTIELMIYTHLWESKHNLSHFKKLADLIDSNPYDWKVEIPSDSKYKFVKNSIRDVFENHELKLYNIFKDCYKSQLRNAFAHSLYHFNLNGPSFVLENYDNRNNQIQYLSFDDWTLIFLKSALLQNFYHNKFSEEIESLPEGKEYEVILDYKDHNLRSLVSYDKERKSFRARMK